MEMFRTFLTWLSGGRRITLGSSSLRSREKLEEALLHVQRFGRIEEPRSAILAFYTRIHEEHWLRDKVEEGRIVILEDESMWEIHPSDRQITERWPRILTINVKHIEINVKHTEREGYPISFRTGPKESMRGPRSPILPG